MCSSLKGKHRAFYERPLCRVSNILKNDEYKKPKIEAEDSNLLLYFKLCKAGYASGLEEAKKMTAREVMQALAYEKFCTDYEAAFLELNRKS